jgi:hypothetical protein
MGLLVNLPGVAPKTAFVGIRRNGLAEVYLHSWQPLGESPLTETQQTKKAELLNRLQTVFGMTNH